MLGLFTSAVCTVFCCAETIWKSEESFFSSSSSRIFANLRFAGVLANSKFLNSGFPSICPNTTGLNVSFIFFKISFKSLILFENFFKSSVNVPNIPNVFSFSHIDIISLSFCILILLRSLFISDNDTTLLDKFLSFLISYCN